jgi:hypothetical protein
MRNTISLFLTLSLVLALGTAVFAADAASAPAATSPAAKAALPAIEKVEVGAGGGLLVNGKAFFPLMGFYQSPKSFKNASATGLNGYFFPGNDPAPKAYLDALKAEGLYGMVPFDANVVGHSAVLGWLLPHEPDAAYLKGKEEMSPAAMLVAYEKIKKADPARPVVLDFSPAFTNIPEESNVPEAKKKEIYPAYAKAADILTYNVYPIWGFNKPECLDWPAKAAVDLRALVGPKKPFFAMIETGKGAPSVPVDQQKDVSADEIRAEAWMAICHGATGIIYFTHQFKPKFNEFGPDAAKQAAIKKINDQIAELAPILAGKEAGFLKLSTDSNSIPANTARVYDGRRVLFVLNGSPNRQGCKVTFSLDTAGEGIVAEVVGEGRTISLKDGKSFTDDFAPLALHIYKVGLPGTATGGVPR